jgi:hypothetical protein
MEARGEKGRIGRSMREGRSFSIPERLEYARGVPGGTFRMSGKQRTYFRKSEKECKKVRRHD